MTPEDINYVAQGLTAINFVKYASEHKVDFINYLEAIIDPKGKIYFAAPNHLGKIMELASEEYGFDKSEVPINCDVLSWIISKYGFIAIWYDMMKVPRKKTSSRFMELSKHLDIMETCKAITFPQSRTIKILTRTNLISDNPYIELEDEYQMHLYRKSVLGID